MKKTDSEQDMLGEFAEFIDADPATPAKAVDAAVLAMVAQDLRPAPWKIFAKLTLVEVATGLVTLALCPQFGLGFGSHSEFLHHLHAATSQAIFFLLCGLLFVTFGAVLGGRVLSRPEIRAVSRSRNRFFAGYSLLAYGVLVTLGPEEFVVSSLTWVVGALLGNLLGYAAGVQLRQVTAKG